MGDQEDGPTKRSAGRRFDALSKSRFLHPKDADFFDGECTPKAEVRWIKDLMTRFGYDK